MSENVITLLSRPKVELVTTKYVKDEAGYIKREKNGSALTYTESVLYSHMKDYVLLKQSEDNSVKDKALILFVDDFDFSFDNNIKTLHYNDGINLIFETSEGKTHKQNLGWDYNLIYTEIYSSTSNNRSEKVYVLGQRNVNIKTLKKEIANRIQQRKLDEINSTLGKLVSLGEKFFREYVDNIN